MEVSVIKSIPMPTMQRLPSYLRFVSEEKRRGAEYVSSVYIAEKLGLNSMSVKKDLSFVVRSSGKPKLGFFTSELIEDISRSLGYNDTSKAVLVGAGKLGKTIISYEGLKNYGLNITAAFDNDPKIVGNAINGVHVFSVDKMQSFIKRTGVMVGIITVPKEYAQGVCEMLVDSGVRAIWNFAPANLTVSDRIALHNEDLATSFAVLNGKLQAVLNKV